MMMIDKTYQPDVIALKEYQVWENAGFFKPTSGTKNKSYCIMLPPPNVTGSLHMGHGFQQTIMDVLIRYHRMQGYQTLWQGGTDHAGIATQLLVERQLEQKNITRELLGREAFTQTVWAWKKTSGDAISQQMRKMGVSIDWSSERFTMDEGFSQAVNTAFIKLYQDGLIYRGKRLVNWDVSLQSAVSDLEVISTEEPGHLFYINYLLANSPDRFLTIATTRPETLFGDVAIAVHPEDTRYQHLIGQHVILPLMQKKIPVIADLYVDPSFGTGCVKITPAHDFNDYAIGQRHGLEAINILNQNGTLNHLTPFEHIDRLKARKIIVDLLTHHQLMHKIEPCKINTPRCERTGEIIEPFLTNQWYVSMKPLAKRAIEATQNGQIVFIPENWQKIYLQWLDNIQDWCISRQLWWGHRIPAFYDASGQVFVGNYADRTDLTQGNDVLDTWFSSALWPFATLGWPEKTERLTQFYPTNTLVTGFDIIFFWVARMVMFGLYFTDQVPFRTVYITGLIRDPQGQKMSKSKGNVLDPIDLIEGISLEDLIHKRTAHLINPKMADKIRLETQKEFPQGIPAFGADALRFTFCALANTGRDIRFDFSRVAGYRNFCNKIWNASRFLLMNKNHFTVDETSEENKTHSAVFKIIHAWLFSKLHRLINQIHIYFQQYRFDLMTQAIQDFVWHDYCDWYLEYVKIGFDLKTQENAFFVFEQILKLLHPIMPYITQAIWRNIHPEKQDNNVMQQAYPEYHAELIAENAEQQIHWLQAVITTIRNLRSEMQISPAKRVTIIFSKGNNNDQANVALFQVYIQTLARIENIQWLESNRHTTVSTATTAVVGELQIFMPLMGLIDTSAEKNRLQKEIKKLTLEIEKSAHRLNNAAYMNNAPPAVVQKEQVRVKNLHQTLEKLQAQFNSLAIS